MLYATVGMGCIALFTSVSLALYFYRSAERVAKSVGHMYLAEGVAMAMTVIFSVGEGVFANAIPPTVQTVMRVVMFGACLASSIHMGVTLDKVLRRLD